MQNTSRSKKLCVEHLCWRWAMHWACSMPDMVFFERKHLANPMEEEAAEAYEKASTKLVCSTNRDISGRGERKRISKKECILNKTKAWIQRSFSPIGKADQKNRRKRWEDEMDGLSEEDETDASSEEDIGHQLVSDSTAEISLPHVLSFRCSAQAVLDLLKGACWTENSLWSSTLRATECFAKSRAEKKTWGSLTCPWQKRLSI